MGTMKSWWLTRPPERRYDYSDRWTIVDDVVRKLVWIPVHELKIRPDSLVEGDWVQHWLDKWHNSAEANWTKTNASEDIRVEYLEIFDHDTFQKAISVKVMARFYEETYMIYLLKWK